MLTRARICHKAVRRPMHNHPWSDQKPAQDLPLRKPREDPSASYICAPAQKQQGANIACWRRGQGTPSWF